MTMLMEMHESRQARLVRLGVTGHFRSPPSPAGRQRAISPFSRLRDPSGSLQRDSWWRPDAVFYDLGPFNYPRPADWKVIALECAVKYRITFNDLMSVRRMKAIVAARHEAFWRIRNETKLSLPQIGMRFGGKDHTTVLHGINKHQKLIDAGEAL